MGLFVGAAVLAAWAYAPTFIGLAHLWQTDPSYSQGFLVPILAIGLAVLRCRQTLPVTRPELAAGIGLLGVAALIRAVAAYYYVTPLDHLSLLVTLTGIVVFAGGWSWLRRVWPALAVLVFALPIPASLGGNALLGVLQEFSTRASTFLLQALGTTAYREGNVILTPSAELGVVEACSGLKMLMVFCALATVTAALIPLGRVQRVLLVLSAVPLALFCNVARITIAGLASGSLGSEAGQFVFHDLAGWLMVPLAFGLLTLEIVVLAKLIRPLPA